VGKSGSGLSLPRFTSPEPADFLAGGKRVNIDTLEIRVIPDGSTAASALQTSEVDFMQYAPFDLRPVLEKNAKVKVVNFTGGNMFAGAHRLNAAQKPFDDPAIRRVLWKLVDQREVLDGLGLDAKYATPCATFFTCGTTYDSKAVTDAAANPSIEAARAALKAPSRSSAAMCCRAGMALRKCCAIIGCYWKANGSPPSRASGRPPPRYSTGRAASCCLAS
jgi:peptide/nickel transport system substrate-binding protein